MEQDIAIFGATLATTVVAALVLKIIWLSRRAKLTTAAKRLLGTTGKTETILGPGGVVRLNGELWPALSESRIPPGEQVQVIGFRGVALEVVQSATTGRPL